MNGLFGLFINIQEVKKELEKSRYELQEIMKDLDDFRIELEKNKKILYSILTPEQRKFAQEYELKLKDETH